LAPPQTGQTDKFQATGLPLASKQSQCQAWDAKTLCHTCSHVVGFPISTRQDEIEALRNFLIEGLEGQLGQQVDEQTLFNVEWSLD
jgi:hypothetical protein